jgi:predicted metal-binding protein
LVDKKSTLKEKHAELLKLAEDKGAYKAKIIASAMIVVEDRAQMRCLIPRCTSYNRTLTCPPNLPNPGEVRKMISEYQSDLPSPALRPVMRFVSATNESCYTGTKKAGYWRVGVLAY